MKTEYVIFFKLLTNSTHNIIYSRRRHVLCNNNVYYDIILYYYAHNRVIIGIYNIIDNTYTHFLFYDSLVLICTLQLLLFSETST